MSDNLTVSKGAQEIYVRQPVFDREKIVMGYGLSVFDGMLPSPGVAADLTQRVSAFVDSMMMSGVDLSMDKRLFLSLPSDESLDMSLLPSEIGSAVVNVCVDGQSGFGLSDSMPQSAVLGVHEADDRSASSEDLAGKCDVIKISLAGKKPLEIVDFRRKYKNYQGKLFAADVVDWEAYEGTRALGFQFFQGPFFSVPEIREDAKLQATSIAKLQLLGELNNPDCGMNELASIIASDITLSYRILRYINSASFGFRMEIKSIQQAVALLGLKELKHWATVVVMTDLDSTSKGEELAYMALHRARFLALFTEPLKEIWLPSDAMFMLGLFSKLDALLSYPMKKALEGIPLDEEIRAALCGADNEYGDLIRLLEAVEAGNCALVSQILEQFDASYVAAATEYMRAATWTAQQLSNMNNKL